MRGKYVWVNLVPDLFLSRFMNGINILHTYYLTIKLWRKKSIFLYEVPYKFLTR
jgi:hypothetical protein